MGYVAGTIFYAKFILIDKLKLFKFRRIVQNCYEKDIDTLETEFQKRGKLKEQNTMIDLHFYIINGNAIKGRSKYGCNLEN